MRLRSDVHFYPVDDSAIVFCEASQSICAFDSKALWLWREAAEGADPRTLVTTLADCFGLSATVARREIDGILDGWRAGGLLNDPVPLAPGPTAERLRERVQDAAARPLRARAPRLRRYRVLGSVIAVSYPDPQIERRVHAVLAHLAAEPQIESSLPTLAVRGSGDRFSVFREEEAVSAGVHPAVLGHVVKNAVLGWAVKLRPHRLRLHTAAVESALGGLLIPAPSGSGKSLLTAALCRAGYRYLSDEAVLLEGDALHARAVPTSLCVKSGGWEPLADLYPELSALPLHERPDGEPVRYLPPPNPSTRARVTVRHVVFPAHAPGARGGLEPLAGVEALARLLGQCVAVDQPLEAGCVAGLVDWSRRVSFHALSVSSLADAVERVRSIVPPPETR